MGDVDLIHCINKRLAADSIYHFYNVIQKYDSISSLTLYSK